MVCIQIQICRKKLLKIMAAKRADFDEIQK